MCFGPDALDPHQSNHVALDGACAYDGQIQFPAKRFVKTSKVKNPISSSALGNAMANDCALGRSRQRSTPTVSFIGRSKIKQKANIARNVEQIKAMLVYKIPGNSFPRWSRTSLAMVARPGYSPKASGGSTGGLSCSSRARARAGLSCGWALPSQETKARGRSTSSATNNCWWSILALCLSACIVPRSWLIF